MSYDARQWVRRHSQAKKTALILIAILADDAGKDGATWRGYSMEELGEIARTSARQVQRNVAWLVKKGELRVQKGSGRGHKSTYVIAAIADGWRATKGDSGDAQRVTVATEKGDSGDAQRVTVEPQRVTVATEKGDSGDSGNAFRSLLKANTNNNHAQEHQSSSSSALPPIDDDDEFFACDLWLGDFSEKRYSAAQVRCAAQHMGDEFGLHAEWAGFDGWVKRTDPQQIAWMLAWLQFYGDKPIEAQFQIKSLTAVIKAHLKKSERAHLRPAQMAELERTIALACEIENLPAKLASAVQARHGGAAWVPAEAPVEHERGAFWM